MTEQQEAYLEAKERFLDQFIDHGSEHALFVSSYIHGHFSVVAANMPHTLVNLDEFTSTFKARLYSTVEQAIANKELSSDDANAVLEMLGAMFENRPYSGGKV
jgi:hypothetical protein